MKSNTVHSPRWFVLAALAYAVALLATQPVNAHDLKAEVKPVGDSIRVEAGFDDGMPAEGARGELVDSDGKTIVAGVLDEKGVWSFPKPGPGTYRIVVEQTGHRDTVQLIIPEGTPPMAIARWRLDKDLGLVIGLALLLGGTVGYMLLRQRRRDSASARTATTNPAAEA